MSNREKIKTKREEIVQYWFSVIDGSDFSVDASEAHERCWRCGCEKALERCHIIPESLGGKDEPSNLVLLCKRCHLENPNVSDPEIMWDWLKAYKVPFYDTFWYIQGMGEYKRIYNKSIAEELTERNINDFENFEKIVSTEIGKTTFHFGHPYLNVATIAAVYRMALRKWDDTEHLRGKNELEST